MAGASMKDIKLRIKSVESTRQITKAMELVASSKLRRAKERAENSQPFFQVLMDSLQDIAANSRREDSPFTAQRQGNKACYILVAGDRGLAGGYNSNVLKLFHSKLDETPYCVLPIGKKAHEYVVKSGCKVLSDLYGSTEQMDREQAHAVGLFLRDEFLKGSFDRLFLVYTTFRSMLSQVPECIQLLPVEVAKKDKPAEKPAVRPLTLYEPSAVEVFDAIIPEYLSGVTYGAVCESFASEQAARRMAMDSASKNATDMIEDLSLRYNRARQGAITQEITEIVAGAEA